MTTFAYGQDVTLVSRIRSGEDAFGNDMFTETQTTLTNVPVWPRSSSENVQGEDQSSIGVAALLPAGTPVTAFDAVLIDGLRYEVDGDPDVFQSPFTNLTPGVQLNLKRVTG